MKSRKGRFIPCGLLGKGDRWSNDLSSSSLGSWLEVVFKDKTCNTHDSAVQSWHVSLSMTVSAPSLSCKVIWQVNLARSQKMACHFLYKPNLSWREKESLGKRTSLGKLVKGKIWSGVLATLCLDISQRFLLFSPSNSFPEVFHFLNIFYTSRDFLLLLISQLIGDYSTLLIFWLSMSCKNTICFYNHSLTPLSRFREARNTFCFMNHIYPII